MIYEALTILGARRSTAELFAKTLREVCLTAESYQIRDLGHRPGITREQLRNSLQSQRSKIDGD